MKTKAFSQIITPRLIIRPVSMDDAAPCFIAQQVSINELAPHWSWALTDKSIDDVKAFIAEALVYNEKEHSEEMYFSLLSKETNQFLGMLWFYKIDWFLPKFEMHYWLDSKASGNGYMTEAINALTRACFDLYQAKRVEIKISSENGKSIRLAQKLNFKLEAEMQNYFINFFTNEVHNGFLYSCCQPNVLPPLDFKIQLEDYENEKINFLIRDISPDDFTSLDSYFGQHSIYKKPKNHWQNYLKEHENHNRIVKVVEMNHHAIAFGTLKFKTDYPGFEKNNIPEINDILVAPDYRRRGIGRTLVKALEDSARENNYSLVGLGVGLYPDYGSAQRLYIKMGYVPNGLGITYQNEAVIPGASYPVDDELLLWLTKLL